MCIAYWSAYIGQYACPVQDRKPCLKVNMLSPKKNGVPKVGCLQNFPRLITYHRQHYSHNSNQIQHLYTKKITSQFTSLQSRPAMVTDRLSTRVFPEMTFRRSSSHLAGISLRRFRALVLFLTQLAGSLKLPRTGHGSQFVGIWGCPMRWVEGSRGWASLLGPDQ